MSGIKHWRWQRLSALALIPLVPWLLFNLLLLEDFSSDSFAHWLKTPIPAGLFWLTVSISLYHSKLGIQVILEDYVQDESIHKILFFISNLISTIVWLLLSFSLFGNLNL